MRGRDRNLGMGNEPARTLHAVLQRRNVFDEWGLELRGGFGDGQSFMEVSRVKPGSAAEKGGIAIGDRLITVNEVFVVFLPVRDVMIAFDIVDTVARVEFERPTRRSEFASREAVRREVRSLRAGRRCE